jgi:hypothetical protein
VKQYLVPALVFATVLAASPIPLSALADDMPEHRMVDARAAHSRHPAEDILVEPSISIRTSGSSWSLDALSPCASGRFGGSGACFPPAEDGSPWN